MYESQQMEKLLNILADINTINVLPADQHVDLLQALTKSIEHFSLFDTELRQELCGVAALHPNPWVRHLVIQALAPFCTYDDVVEVLIWLTHDPEDFVIFQAADICGKNRVQRAVGDLMMLIGRPSARLTGQNGKPVGLGHVVVLNALIAIFGTDDPVNLHQLEEEVKPPTLEAELPLFMPNNAVPSLCSCSLHAHQGMSFIPAGPVHIRVPDAFDKQLLLFDWSDVILHEQIIDVSSFYIDTYPVTCAEYDAFASSDAAKNHQFCHPSEPDGKLHVRNTFLDKRFHSDHPAVGVDWFDAYAYAASIGKRLPTEWEWQRAAQGDSSRAYPWGISFDSRRCRWLGEVIHRPSLSSITDWRNALYQIFTSRDVHTLTVPVDKLDNVSPYGVIGLSGNCWEWTMSSSITGQCLTPQVKGLDIVEVTKDWRSYPVIRGGAWSALPELTSVAFRGRDLLTDRHFENGFRCVCSN